MKYKFTEVLNDLINFFLLGDVQLLEEWKKGNNLSDNLAMEFTTNESAEAAVCNGIILPMAGIENYPYTIYFDLGNETPELLGRESRLQFRHGGYSLKIANKKLMLFTWRILEQFTADKVDDLIRDYLHRRKPIIELDNGWYSIEVLGGETLQNDEYEPTLEFIIRRTDGQVAEKVNINESFTIRSSTY